MLSPPSSTNIDPLQYNADSESGVANSESGVANSEVDTNSEFSTKLTKWWEK